MDINTMQYKYSLSLSLSNLYVYFYIREDINPDKACKTDISVKHQLSV